MRDNLPLVVVALAVGAAGVAILSGSWQVRPVVSGSMRPALQPGDVVVTEREPISSLQVGDVIVFHPPQVPDELVVHRVLEIHNTSQGVVIITKGDANNSIDHWSPFVLQGPYIYREHFALPLLGYPGIWIHSRFAQLLLFWGGGLVALTALVWMFLPQRERPRRRPDEAV